MKEKVVGPNGLIGEACQLHNTSFGTYTEIGDNNVFDNVMLGDYSYTGQNCIVQNVEIGKFANIAAHVRIGPTDHPMERPTLHHITYRRRMFGLADTDDLEFFRYRASRMAFIGHDTWIGHGAIIMPEVRIGDGAVVGSGAVVTRDVEPYTIVVGVPAKLVRRRFSPEIVAQLQAIAWWDWGHQELKENLEYLSGSIEEFVERFGSGGQS